MLVFRSISSLRVYEIIVIVWIVFDAAVAVAVASSDSSAIAAVAATF